MYILWISNQEPLKRKIRPSYSFAFKVNGVQNIVVLYQKIAKNGITYFYCNLLILFQKKNKEKTQNIISDYANANEILLRIY